MPVHKPFSDDKEIGFFLDSTPDNKVSVLLADLVSDTRADKAAEIKTKLQDGLDLRIAKTDLPADDERRTTDPDRAVEKWDGDDLLTRHILVTDVVWNSARGVFLARIERVR